MMPLALEVDAKYRFALIQSDEPKYCVGYEEEARQDFLLPGFHHIITSDSMMEFGSKYNMTIVGKVEAGVDSTVFYPTWTGARPQFDSVLFFHGPESSPQELQDRMMDCLSLFRNVPECKIIGMGQIGGGWPCDEQWKLSTEQERRSLYNHSALFIMDLYPPDAPPIIELEAGACGCPVATVDDVLATPGCLDDYGWASKNALHGFIRASVSPWSVQQQKFLDIINSVIGR
jgi:hypothetical protein